MHYLKLENEAKGNTNFRKVLATGNHTQVVVMSIPVGEDIGMETHEVEDQVLYFIEGQGKAILNGEEQDFVAGDAVLVPSGTEHNFVNTGEKDLKIITMYSPSHHPDGKIHVTKADAENDEY